MLASTLAGSSSSSAPRIGDRSKQGCLFIVVPAYNEEANLPGLLASIEDIFVGTGVPFRVFIVDDGSSDRTAAIAEELSMAMPLTLFRHGGNQGLGAAIRNGLQLACSEAADRDVIVTMDADETHPPGLIPRMVSLIREGHDVVIASRYQPGARTLGVPWYRQILSVVASLLFRALLPMPGVRDYTSGYRAYRAETLKAAFNYYGDAFVEAQGFHCMVDILLKLRCRSVICGEVPLVLRYDFKQGTSKMRVWRTIQKTLSLLIRQRFDFGGSR